MISITAGGYELVLAPEIGGSVARLALDGRQILRGSDAPESALDCGCFPLVPYCNRIRDGRFAFRGRAVSIRPNMAGDRSPLHGQGWLAPWRVEAAEQASAVLAFVHEPGEWPWRYEARQTFELAPDRLDVTLACTNRAPDPMPCGLGQHPYFHCTPETRLDTEVAGAWEIDADVLPTGRVPATGRYDLRDRVVCGQDLDHGFDGWGGAARITDPALPFAIEMSSPDAGFFQLYSPASGGIFVAEPVSHANAALNAPEDQWPDLGLQVLEPGEEMSLTMRLEVTPRASG